MSDGKGSTKNKFELDRSDNNSYANRPFVDFEWSCEIQQLSGLVLGKITVMPRGIKFS